MIASAVLEIVNASEQDRADAIDEDAIDEAVQRVADDYRKAPLTPAARALADMAYRLTREPWEMGATDVEKLRANGFDDEAIHDAYQAAAYFNYINRIADGLGVDLESSMPPEPADWKRPPRAAE